MIGTAVRSIYTGRPGVVLRHHPTLAAWVVRHTNGDVLNYTDDALEVAS